MVGSGVRNTTRHREAAAASRAETRRRLLQAAGEEFAARGYHAATVTRIATRAGVTVQTLYLAWGSKRALLRAYMEASLAGTADAVYTEELRRRIEEVMAREGLDAEAVAAQIAHFYREFAQRAALGWQLYRDAAASDPEVAADWQTLQHLRHETFAAIIGHIDPAMLRTGLTVEAATDTAWAIASPETYDLLVRTLGHSMDEYEQWVASTLAASLLT